MRSAINLTNQYQAELKSTAENQFLPQNSDLISVSSSNLKTNENRKKSDKSKSDKEKKKTSKKSRKKKKSSSSSEQLNTNNSPTDRLNLENMESNESNLKDAEFNTTTTTQVISSNKRPTTSGKRPFTLSNGNNTYITNHPINSFMENLNNLNNESLRWQNTSNNIDEEQKRIELYKMNRRKRYLDQKNIQLLATLSKAKSVLSAINTPTAVKIEELSLENNSNNNTNRDRTSSRLTTNTQHKINLIDEMLSGSLTTSKMNLNENNTFRMPSSSRRKLSNAINLDYDELNSVSVNMASASLLPNRPKSEKIFRSASFILNNNSNSNNKRTIIGGETVISSITSNS